MSWEVTTEFIRSISYTDNMQTSLYDGSSSLQSQAR